MDEEAAMKEPDQEQEEEEEEEDEESLEKLQEEIARMEEEAARLSKETEEISGTTTEEGKTADTAAATAVDAKQPARDSCSVYVGQVDYSATPEELLAHFGACGTVERVTIVCDKFTGRPKGASSVEAHNMLQSTQSGTLELPRKSECMRPTWTRRSYSPRLT